MHSIGIVGRNGNDTGNSNTYSSVWKDGSVVEILYVGIMLHFFSCVPYIALFERVHTYTHAHTHRKYNVGI